MQYLVSPEVQARFATETGYVPMRADALDIEPALSVYRDDPRYRVAYDQLVKTPDSPASLGPILGPQREIRSITACISLSASSLINSALASGYVANMIVGSACR